MKILLRNSPQAPWQKLEPFEFGGPDGEEKLEKLLEKSPDLLTTEGGEPILFFKSQVALGNNAVDLMGVDADGMIVMVECKLEANREARRMVVGQILEYAGQLRSMSYTDFEKMLTGSPDLSLVDMVRPHVSEDVWSEENFRAGVERGLELGDFRLVIAINGMNDELKGIVEYLKARGSVRLEVLELQRFTDEKSGVEALVPQVFGLFGRTSSQSGPNPIYAEFWEQFLKYFKQRDTNPKLTQSLPPPDPWYKIKLDAPKIWIELKIPIRAAKLTCQLVLDNPQSKRIFERLEGEKAQIESELGEEVEWSRPMGEDQRYKVLRNLPGNIQDRDKWKDYFVWLRDQAEAFYKVFHPRINDSI